MQGWIRLNRSLLENQIFNSEPYTKGQAWITLLMLANHKEGYITVKNGDILKIERGECGYSELALADIFKWSRGKVKRFLNLLENEKMIQQKSRSNRNIINIINYDFYQNDTVNGTLNDTVNGHLTVHQTDINKNDKNDKNDKNVEEVVVDAEKLYGKYQNVALSNKQYQQLLTMCLSEKLLIQLMDELSERIEEGKEHPYRAEFPNAHYIRLTKYFEYRRKNPEKFNVISQKSTADILEEIRQKRLAEGKGDF